MCEPTCQETTLTPAALDMAIEMLAARLRGRRNAAGFWEGRLSSSALSTATAISALALLGDGSAADRRCIAQGVNWLSATQNAHNGWGDTVDSPSNLATTLLALSALRLAGVPDDAPVIVSANAYLSRQGGEGPAALVAAIGRRYGADRTFAVPILMNCALAGLVPWDAIPGLPFALAVLPASWYPLVNMRVVSYALPALIAIGLLLDARHPSKNPLVRRLHRAVTPAVLRKLAQLQPSHGGFLDATPLTAFVAMSLIAFGEGASPVARRAVDFLRASMRPDGSWPIDSNLSVWVTTNAVTACARAGVLADLPREDLANWLAARQHPAVHPFTNAAPGGWGWTHLPGGVPDADDTAGALLALRHLGRTEGSRAGVRWLCGLQNADGGWPTFCKGWGRLPFDTSSPDITAHVLRALHAAGAAHHPAVARGFRYLAAAQQANGAWIPLWFGNQQTPAQTNPVFGTARVLLGYQEIRPRDPAAARGVQFLLATQAATGGWGGDRDVAPSVEETAMAVCALACSGYTTDTRPAVARGAAFLLRCVAERETLPAAPIGLYFASLWYAEADYPLVWTLEALGRARGGLAFGV